MTTTNLITVTESAAKEVFTIRQQENIGADKYLRLGVKGGGCSGLSYILEFEEKTDMDELIQENGIDIIVDKRHALYISGMQLDYEYGLNNRGFIFNNPNAKSTCGCGTSFSA